MAATNPEPPCPPIERTGITVLYGDLQSTIDIVLVHGLDGNPAKTWKHGSTGFFWPWELRNFVKEARVMLFGYNTDIVSKLGTNLIRIPDIATSLLIELADHRSKDEEKRRPLILMGHSLGGLVIKKALVLASQDVNVKESKNYQIYTSTAAIFFFGTPHLGSSAGKKTHIRILKTIARVAFKKLPPNIESALGMNSNELYDLANDFQKIDDWPNKRLEIYTYYETMTDARVGDLVVNRNSAKVGSRETLIPIQKSHRNMVRCKNAKDQPFKGVCSRIKELMQRPLEEILRPDKSNYRIPSYPPSIISPVKTFIQRGTITQDIREQLCRKLDDKRKGETKKVGIWGLGGIGKSQLARNYLQQYHNEYDATFWIPSGDPGSINQSFLHIYQSLPEGIAQNEQPATEEIRLAVLSWFYQNAGKWLIVFDSADNLDKEKDYVELSRYIPRGSGVHVIITSRSSLVKKFSTFEGIEVGKLESSEAVELFARCAEMATSLGKVEAEIKLIVKELDYLPLAITIAGSYVQQTPNLSSRLSQYLVEYRRHRHELLQERPHYLTDQYSHSVMTVWETSYAAVYNRLPEACQILTLLAFINNEDIFPDLFICADPTEGSESWASVIGIHDNQRVGMCLSILERYSLLHLMDTGASYAMHNLVRAWAHDRLLLEHGQKGIKRFCGAALQLLSEAIKVGSVQWPKSRLIPHLRENVHAIRCLQTTPEEDLIILDRLQLIKSFTEYHGARSENSLVAQAILEITQRCLGDEHTATLWEMFGLAHSFSRQGKFDDAISTIEEVTEKTQRILGEAHELTILTKQLRGIIYENKKYIGMIKATSQDMKTKTKATVRMLTSQLAVMSRSSAILDETAAKVKDVIPKLRYLRARETVQLCVEIIANAHESQVALDRVMKSQSEQIRDIQALTNDKYFSTLMVMNDMTFISDADKMAKMLSYLITHTQRLEEIVHECTFNHYLKVLQENLEEMNIHATDFKLRARRIHQHLQNSFWALKWTDQFRFILGIH